jgi:hypothetical protein
MGLTKSSHLRLLKRMSGRAIYVSGHACVKNGWGSFSAYFLRFSLSLSLSHENYFALLGFCHKTLDPSIFKPQFSNPNLKTWSSKQDLRFHCLIWDKFKNSSLLRFCVDSWGIEPNLSMFSRFCVFWSILNDLQVLGHVLVDLR